MDLLVGLIFSCGSVDNFGFSMNCCCVWLNRMMLLVVFGLVLLDSLGSCRLGVLLKFVFIICSRFGDVWVVFVLRLCSIWWCVFVVVFSIFRVIGSIVFFLFLLGSIFIWKCMFGSVIDCLIYCSGLSML